MTSEDAMPETIIHIGNHKIRIIVSGEIDQISQAYAEFVAGRIEEVMAGVTREEAHQWLRKHCIVYENLIDYVASGGILPADHPSGLPI